MVFLAASYDYDPCTLVCVCKGESCLFLAQAEGSLDSKQKWEKNLCLNGILGHQKRDLQNCSFKCICLQIDQKLKLTPHPMWNSIKARRNGFFGLFIQIHLV